MVKLIRELKEKLLDCRVISTALVIAAEQAYQSEVVETEMEELWIGEDKDWHSRELWIADKVGEWTDEAEEWLKNGTK